MSSISAEVYAKAYRPLDVVKHSSGAVGLIGEVSCNAQQEGFDDQIRYAVKWFTKTDLHTAWFTHKELKYQCSLPVVISEAMCNNFGSNEYHVPSLYGLGDKP